MAVLRLIATSDLHASVRPFDYFADAPSGGPNLAAAAVAIAAAREEADLALLLDNGDLLQGAPLGDCVAAQRLREGGVHPVIAALGALAYDAATLGNHEFNYGLDVLGDALAGAAYPVVCANVFHVDGRPYRETGVILERDLAIDGARRTIRIGVTGIVPPQIENWDRAHLAERLVAEDAVDALAREVPRLRAAGADIVVVLCHSGIEAGRRYGGEENVALHVARIPGIDAIVAGHLHRIFPGGAEFEGMEGVDNAAGRLAGVPAVMAGFHGSHLGIIDLDLALVDGAVGIVGARAEARPVPPLDLADPPAPARLVLAATQTAHAASLAYVRRPVGASTAPLTTAFAALGQDQALALVAAAQADFVARELAGHADGALPLLSGAAPFAAGGRGGPRAYVDVPAGPLAMRDVAALYPYPNAVCAVRLTGAELREWLERAAGFFAHVDPASRAPQPLLERGFPSYHFDMVAGVSYAIDPTVPARYDRDGDLVDRQARRIRDLAHRGRPVEDDDVFLVATNTYRAGGGGRFCGGRLETVFASTALVRDVLADWVTTNSPIAPTQRLSWRLLPWPETCDVRFATAPDAAPLVPEGVRLEDLGLDAEGFRAYRVRIAAP